MNRFGGPHSVDVLTSRYNLGGVALSIREKCIASPLYLAAEVLSVMWQANLFRTPSEAHLEVEKALIAQENVLYVDHRGTGKTTLVDEVGGVWQLLCHPNDTIIFLQATDVNAKSLSGSVREHFIRNKVLRALFPEYAIDSANDRGNINSWSVPCRTLSAREESVEIGTPGSSLAGRHYDVVKGSDIMNENTTPPPCGQATLELMKSLIAWYAQSDGLLKSKAVNARAHKTLDLNRWHDADLASEIIRRDKKNTFHKVIRGVKRNAAGDFVSSWPQVFSSKELAEIHARPSMNAATWAANFASDPLPEGGMSFLREWFKPYTTTPAKLDIAVSVDPAFSDGKTEKKKTDRSAMVVSGVAPDGNLYILETRAGKWSPNEFIEELWALCIFWAPRASSFWVGIEDIGASRGLKAMFFNEMQRTGRFFPYHALQAAAQGGRKDTRIAPLHNHAQHFGIFVKPEHEELVEELLRFGVAEADDLADALAYRMMDLYMPTILREKAALPSSVPPTPRTTGTDILRILGARERAKNQPRGAPRRRTA